MISSKPLERSDDSSKEFIIKCLKGDKTYGFDIDSVYLMHDNNINQYYIFEYLKCENEYLSPHQSNPKFYPYNWRKFHALFQLSKKLSAKLLLINYSDGYKTIKENNQIYKKELLNKEKYINEVRIFYVSNINYKLLKEYELLDFSQKPKHLDYLEYDKIENLSFDEFSQKLRELNRQCANHTIKWEDFI